MNVCPQCQHENPEASKFCNDCGDRLPAPADADNANELTSTPYSSEATRGQAKIVTDWLANLDMDEEAIGAGIEQTTPGNGMDDWLMGDDNLVADMFPETAQDPLAEMLELPPSPSLPSPLQSSPGKNDEEIPSWLTDMAEGDDNSQSSQPDREFGRGSKSDIQEELGAASIPNQPEKEYSAPVAIAADHNDYLPENSVPINDNKPASSAAKQQTNESVGLASFLDEVQEEDGSNQSIDTLLQELDLEGVMKPISPSEDNKPAVEKVINRSQPLSSSQQKPIDKKPVASVSALPEIKEPAKSQLPGWLDEMPGVAKDKQNRADKNNTSNPIGMTDLLGALPNLEPDLDWLKQEAVENAGISPPETAPSLNTSNSASSESRQPHDTPSLPAENPQLQQDAKDFKFTDELSITNDDMASWLSDLAEIDPETASHIMEDFANTKSDQHPSSSTIEEQFPHPESSLNEESLDSIVPPSLVETEAGELLSVNALPELAETPDWFNQIPDEEQSKKRVVGMTDFLGSIPDASPSLDWMGENPGDGLEEMPAIDEPVEVKPEPAETPIKEISNESLGVDKELEVGVEDYTHLTLPDELKLTDELKIGDDTLTDWLQDLAALDPETAALVAADFGGGNTELPPTPESKLEQEEIIAKDEHLLADTMTVADKGIQEKSLPSEPLPPAIPAAISTSESSAPPLEEISLEFGEADTPVGIDEITESKVDGLSATTKDDLEISEQSSTIEPSPPVTGPQDEQSQAPMPAWLNDLMKSELDPEIVVEQPKSQPEQAKEEIVIEPGIDAEKPDWLQQDLEQEFMSSLAEYEIETKDGENANNEGILEEFFGEEAVSQTNLESSHLEELTLGVDDPPIVESSQLPDWLNNLKPQELRQDSSENPEPEVPAQEHGPLAGMRGIIDIEPVIATPHQAKRKGQRPPISESQKRGADSPQKRGSKTQKRQAIKPRALAPQAKQKHSPVYGSIALVVFITFLALIAILLPSIIERTGIVLNAGSAAIVQIGRWLIISVAAVGTLGILINNILKKRRQKSS